VPQPPPNPDPTQPVAGGGAAQHPPVASDAAPAPIGVGAAPVPATSSWRSKVTGGRALAAGALVVGLGLGALGGSAATWAVTHDDGAHRGTTADARPGFDPDDGGGFPPPRFGPPGGGRGGMPPGGPQQDGGSTGGSTGTGTDANGTSQGT